VGIHQLHQHCHGGAALLQHYPPLTRDMQQHGNTCQHVNVYKSIKALLSCTHWWQYVIMHSELLAADALLHHQPLVAAALDEALLGSIKPDVPLLLYSLQLADGGTLLEYVNHHPGSKLPEDLAR
jgi:hypothetical protein